MVQIGAPGHDAVPIGEVSAPPFAKRPDPAAMFARRAARFREVAVGHELSPYLAFLATIADAQDAVQDGLPLPRMPQPEDLERRREFGMPALDKAEFASDPACQAAVRAVLSGVSSAAMPEPARQALGRLSPLDGLSLEPFVDAVIDDAIPFNAVAEHVFVAAGLQVHAARAAASLEDRRLVPVGEGACPACGSAPVSSVVVGWNGAHGARFCCCSLCGTYWNAVRIRCTACGSTEGIGYREIEGSDGNVKAETCASCRTYLKVGYQVKEPALDPVADDVASSALDVLVSETGMRRSGRNPFLLGY